MALTKDLKLSEELMKYIKASDKKDRIFSEIINKKDNVNRIIKGIKDIQWKIVNYTIALFGLLIGIAKILNIKTINFAIIEYLLLAILAILLWVFSMNMLVKTSEDLKYYRKHMEINEIIEDELTGIIFKTNNLVNELLDDDKRSDYKQSAKENMINFTIPFFVVITIGLVLTILIDIYLLSIV